MFETDAGIGIEVINSVFKSIKYIHNDFKFIIHLDSDILGIFKERDRPVLLNKDKLKEYVEINGVSVGAYSPYEPLYVYCSSYEYNDTRIELISFNNKFVGIDITFPNRLHIYLDNNSLDLDVYIYYNGHTMVEQFALPYLYEIFR